MLVVNICTCVALISLRILHDYIFWQSNRQVIVANYFILVVKPIDSCAARNCP